MQDAVGSVIFFAVGVFLFFYGFKRLKLRRRILGLATSKVRSMAMGTVEIQGRVRIEKPLADPIFSRACGYWRILVEEERGSGKNRRWVTIYSKDSSETPFFVEDSTGVARVLPSRAEIQFPPEVSSRIGIMGGGAQAEIKQFVSAINGGGWSTQRVTAHILREGQPLFLVGYASPATSESAATPATPRDAARLLKSDPVAMKKLDANSDGVVDEREWEDGVAKKTAALSAAGAAGQPLPPPGDPLISVSRCPDGLFILANNQENLLSKLGWTAWGSIIAGPALALGAAAALFVKWQQGFFR